jgi:hypothetical protein
MHKEIKKDYHSAIKKNQITMSFAGKWMEMESIVPSYISQTPKDKHHIFSP